MMLPGDSSVPPTRDDLRRLEARLDARLQEINARLVMHDGRFAAMGDRVNQADRRNDALSARVEARMRSMDRRFDTIDIRLDVLAAQLDAIGHDFAAIRDRINKSWWQRGRRVREHPRRRA